MISSAGFPNSLHATIASRIASDDLPTLVLDQELTQSTMQKAVDAVEPTLVSHREGEVIYRRGDRLSAAQYERTIREAEQFATSGPSSIDGARDSDCLTAGCAIDSVRSLRHHRLQTDRTQSMEADRTVLAVDGDAQSVPLRDGRGPRAALRLGYRAGALHRLRGATGLRPRLAIFLCGVQAAHRHDTRAGGRLVHPGDGRQPPPWPN